MEENGQFGSTKSAAASLGSPAIEVGLTEEAETLKSETKHRKMNVEEQTEDWWARVLDSDQQRLRRRMFRSRPWIKIGLGLQRLARAWFSLIQEWNVQWRELQLMLGVYQFVR
ncbi:unnamed protein product [Protopolystoma xenopodis]|uniref:Uncharacterized protein n=1 Tax=Protopolystoma xenopodis TaxID=117903 RepID=A0A3S5B7T7_9PLAT|nr:unnamed protein product [Protopolystoma xenopodis]